MRIQNYKEVVDLLTIIKDTTIPHVIEHLDKPIEEITIDDSKCAIKTMDTIDEVLQMCFEWCRKHGYLIGYKAFMKANEIEEGDEQWITRIKLK